MFVRSLRANNAGSKEQLRSTSAWGYKQANAKAMLSNLPCIKSKVKRQFEHTEREWKEREEEEEE